MTKANRSYCCCCVPFRFAVAIFSTIALALGGASLWSVLRVGTTDSTTRIAAYIATGVYGLLGVAGLISVFFKKYALAKNFSVLWWTVTFLVTVLSVINIIFLATREKEAVMGLCRTQLLKDDDRYFGPYDPNSLFEDVDGCYRWVMIITGICTAVQVVLMAIGGWVASKYTSEVKHHKEGLTYTYGQGYGPVTSQPQHPPYQPAHPYTHISGKH
ncbi:hypothetical protein BX616_007277 [Lobosporangium transversale]|uniref:Tetraspanin family-domain-containing protein n=1 Tax=Lobosporangium transversale TaxID=64571 RepID=A0A1Y2GVI3_9FUNG|nr:hypothetical protein BCR41DRAFT_385630 [Lobosporangium transversale]KAF9914937.1 hypothetical protein BX616_007277 [Lobosporangium transversale]ORZ20059.1 hypothetical protein BCR41DRAFT_385630 [Lobosporangium transversale]|eukprot:XP_021882599.1 hypothetical protein BCR41DRAFT_385630 [Lobosporangium transversale]